MESRSVAFNQDTLQWYQLVRSNSLQDGMLQQQVRPVLKPASINIHAIFILMALVNVLLLYFLMICLARCPF